MLKPEGWFSFSLFHPCFPGGEGDAARTLSSWPPEGGYAAEGWWSTGESGVRGHVGANHRMISTYLNAVLRAGLTFDRFVEPPSRLPWLFVMMGRRPGQLLREPVARPEPVREADAGQRR